MDSCSGSGWASQEHSHTCPTNAVMSFGVIAMFKGENVSNVKSWGFDLFILTLNLLLLLLHVPSWDLSIKSKGHLCTISLNIMKPNTATFSAHINIFPHRIQSNNVLSKCSVISFVFCVSLLSGNAFRHCNFTYMMYLEHFFAHGARTHTHTHTIHSPLQTEKVNI